MDDRFLYFGNWLHGDLRQYDVGDPPQPEADRPTVAGRRAEQSERRRPRADRWAPDAPALVRRPPPLRHELALLDLGQPVLSRVALLAAARQLRPKRRHGDQPRLLRRLLRPPGRSGTGARGPPPERRLHHGDLPTIIAHIMGIPIEENVL
jgi:hypothetical protein